MKGDSFVMDIYSKTFTYSSPGEEEEKWLKMDKKEQVQFLVDRQLVNLEEILQQWVDNNRNSTQDISQIKSKK